MTAQINIKFELPENCEHCNTAEITEWIQSALGAIRTMSVSNPLSKYEFGVEKRNLDINYVILEK